MSNIKWQTGEPPKNGNYLIETDKAIEVDYWVNGTWDNNGNAVIHWLPLVLLPVSAFAHTENGENNELV